MENQSEDDGRRQESQQAQKQLQLLKRRRKPKQVRSHALVNANGNRGADEEMNRERCEEPLREKKPLGSLVRSFEYISSSTSSQLVPAALHYGEQYQSSKRPGPKIKPTVIWSCSMCDRECIPVREQSRCLCGHRLKDHPMKQLANGKTSSKCCNGKCQCPRFFFVVAEGAWVLRCSCKHKHTDHDPKTHKCSRGSCACNKFFSPWVCNCDHPWSAHEQRIEYRRVKTLEEMVQELAVGGDDVKRTDLHAEPLKM